MKKILKSVALVLSSALFVSALYGEAYDTVGMLKVSNISTNELSAMSLSNSSKINEAGSYSIWGGKGAIVTGPNKMAVKFNDSNRVDSIVSATNIDGTTASIVPKVGDVKRLTNYVKVATPKSGKEVITVNYSVNQSKRILENPHLSYWILITDESGKILALKDVGDINKEDNVVKCVDFSTDEIEVGENIIIGFSRGSGSGGLLIHSVSQKPVM